MLCYCRYFIVLFLISSSIIFLSIFIVSNNNSYNKNIVPAGFVTVKTTSVVFMKPNMVTKSMKEMFESSGLSDHVVFFNRIPKSGAELFSLLLQNIKGVNAFLHVRLKGIESVLGINEQRAIVLEVAQKIRQEAVPMIIDRNVHFLNFTKFGAQSPMFINFVRNPVYIILSRLQYLIKKKVNDKQFDLNLCIINNYYLCKLNNIGDNYFIIPYFCGHDDICIRRNSRKSLNQAKNNVEKYFSVVGILEELNATLEVFDNKLHYFFKGARKFYEGHLMVKIPKNIPIIVSNQAQAIIRDKVYLEYEFYTWLKDRLFQQLKMTYADHSLH